MTTDRWGIDDGYHDTLGAWRPTTDRTRAALLSTMGVGDGEADDAVGIRIITRGEIASVDGPAELWLEDGTRLTVERALPPDLPAGYHELRTGDRRLTLLVSPGRCHPPPTDAWGWAVQLYATRSRDSWGLGDFADLTRLARWSRELGARVLLANPFHAAVPAPQEDPSPYSPSSRRYRNPLYLRIEDVPGAAALGPELETLRAAGRALNRERLIDRDRVRRLKSDALERLWARFTTDPAFERYVGDEGAALEDFAIFTTLAETHGAGWRTWPGEYRRPDTDAVRRFAAAHADRVRYHQWVQWLLDRQLARAAAEIALLHDFPVGVDGNGADAWAWQDVLATEAAVGAPPDRYARHGQNWGLPPFIPHRLRAARYAPFVQTLRGVLRHGGGLRIDHVMGLFRLFWIPRGLEPGEGGYVRYPADELLAIIAIESERARAFVVGEDLGTVEAGVRERLAEAGILSYRVLWFEEQPPASYPALALASVTTHDLPTIAGVWTGADLLAQRTIGLDPNPEIFDGLRARLSRLSDVPPGGPVEEVIAGTYEELAKAPSAIVTATLEDAVAVEERPNMPGTVGVWPNWSLALPRPLEDIEEAELPRQIAAVLNSRTAAKPPRS
ncbi:MAG: 4-alpha-glucanotransferase [Candidatus Rokubacteria bacterium]|nr:4-alpha-glucanotransferase [Candidatus Rokubacteria bacterium]